ncbi:MAG: LamG-like jellyroll fold domain-containing protein [Bacteroidales bacterium]
MKANTSTLKTVFTFLSAILIYTGAQSQQVIKAYFNTGKAGSVTFAAAPDVLKDLSGQGNDLTRSGSPQFFADAPADKKLEGEGSILFKDAGGYSLNKTLGHPSEKFILETWLNASSINPDPDRPNRYSTALAFGDNNKGYLIAQRAEDWILVIDGKVVTKPIAKVSANDWIHIALISDGRQGTVYINGEKRDPFELAKEIAPNFSVGFNGKNGYFKGMVYEVRLSNYGSAKFNPGKNLLLNVEELTKARKAVTDKQIQLIATLSKLSGITAVNELKADAVKEDWLITPVRQKVQLFLQTGNNGETCKLLLTNGLASRTFYLADNLTCISFKNLSNDSEYIRAVKPEAKLMLDSVWYDVGGLSGQPEKAYFLESWCKDLTANPGSFLFSGMDMEQPKARYPWQVKFNAVNTDWPPKGLHLIMHYQPPVSAPGILVDVHYEMYEGLPAIRKWITLRNSSGREIVVNKMECEVLAVAQDQKSRMQIESDYSFAMVNNAIESSSNTLYPAGEAPTPARFGQTTTQWETDPEYSTWATHNMAEDYYLKFPHLCLLKSTLLFGPSAHVSSDSLFESFSTFELLFDNDDRERQTLGHRKFYRKLAPQVTESLITGGITSHDPEKLKSFIDQMYELGFERLDIQAWPGISHDDLSDKNITLWKDIAGYAKAKNIITGGYELQVASRGRGAEYDCIEVKTGKPGSFFGQSVCIASKWQDVYYPKMWQFFDKTGLMSLNVDGPYHGDACASTIHPHHNGYYDSQWEQWKFQVSVIHEVQQRNMYAPMPDWYFLNGQASTGMGYREASANLTPQQQLLLSRQYIYDGTWHKAPSMGWIGLQLVGFYSNDPRIGLEPLSENIDRYEIGLFQYLASGCQFSVRGNRLYDTPATKAVVKKWIDWFKKYRDILTSDIIHISRPTGRDLDAIFHVNPQLKNKGMLIIFNPTEQDIQRDFKIPLYYTGIRNSVRIREQEGMSGEYTLNHDYEAVVPVTVKAGGYTWLVIE